MPRVIDLRNSDDTRDVVHLAVQALAEGKIVGFPTESVYVLAAGGLCEPAVRQLRALSKHDAQTPLTLAVKSAEEAIDYVPNLSRLGRRLARRCWPGPVTLLVDNHHPDGLLHQLPRGAQQAVAPSGMLGLRVPAHQVLQDVLRLLTGPVVMAGAGNDAGFCITAQQVVESFGDGVQLVLDDGPCRIGQPASTVRIHDDTLEIVRAGAVSEQALRRLAGTMVLFVCTGNTCRSPMAETLFRARLAARLECKPEELEERGYVVLSAGIAAMLGGKATPEAQSVMSARKLDLRRHESRPLTETLVRHADLLIVMTRSHRHAVVAEWPEAAGRVKLICASGGDVADPIGGPIESYRRCADQIDAELDHWIDETLGKTEE